MSRERLGVLVTVASFWKHSPYSTQGSLRLCVSHSDCCDSVSKVCAFYVFYVSTMMRLCKVGLFSALGGLFNKVQVFQRHITVTGSFSQLLQQSLASGDCMPYIGGLMFLAFGDVICAANLIYNTNSCGV
jgi:hypothetical protein